MACISPVTCYWSKKVNPSGKRSLVYSSRGSLDGKPFQRPCGQCVNCRIQITADMTVRLVHESKSHNRNSYLTLTYDKEPEDGSLCHRHFQLFMKRLRQVTGSRLKYYMCGEYGDKNDRPHYHCILFGYDFDDKRYHSQNKNGDKLYTSDELLSYWQLGHCVVGDVAMQSCRYVAGYIQKKIYGEKAADWYMGRKPEYAFGSNGLGLDYLRRYGAQWMDTGFVVVDGAKFRIPRYYDIKYKEIDGLHFDGVKDGRLANGPTNPHELDGSFNRYSAVSESISARLNKRKFDYET
ncbi:MAG: replication initiator protein [Microviridae sp.]|nr:MAG: replication initiator protein [Microviridae sp.]